MYVQDQWTIRRLTLNYGLRFDYLRGYVPPQRVAPTPFVGERNFGEVDCVPQTSTRGSDRGFRWPAGSTPDRIVSDRCFVVDSRQELLNCHIVQPFQTNTQLKLNATYSSRRQICALGACCHGGCFH
jgi:hypothetical protein